MEASAKPKSPSLRFVISLFIIWNISAILLTNTIFNISWSVQKIFYPYARVTRLMQRWALLSPEPRRVSKVFHFVITFKDGSTTSWQRPYPPNWNYFDRQHSYSWQKFDLAGGNMENPTIWPDVAQWVARKFQNDKNPPVKIQSYCTLADVPPPRERGYVQPDPSEFHSSEQLLFTYDLSQ